MSWKVTREKSRARITRKETREREVGRESLPSRPFCSSACSVAAHFACHSESLLGAGRIKLLERGSATFYSLVLTSFAGNPTLLWLTTGFLAGKLNLQIAYWLTIFHTVTQGFYTKWRSERWATFCESGVQSIPRLLPIPIFHFYLFIFC